MNLLELFERFVREKTYLSNVTPKTVSFYRQSFNAYIKAVGEVMPDRFVLNDFVIKLRERGMSPTGANVYIRGINSFLSWLWENNQLGERLKIKQMKEEQKIIQTYTEAHIKAFVNWKPDGWYEWRMYALLCTLIDTGARIDRELLPLKREKVDLDNCLIRLSGKGNKERFVPMSLELRRILYRWLDKNEYDLVFPTRDGVKLSYRNAFRDFKNLCTKLGIEGVRTSFHTFRHTFAVNYVRNGGNIFYLQKALGHASLQVTRRYTELSEEDLKLMHKQTSILGRLR
jgi:integrase/recombinase XerD